MQKPEINSELLQDIDNKPLIKPKRIESLDWLRGLMALSIMLYHLSVWYFIAPDATSLLGRMGIYGVSIFFILSGLSMAIVYHHFIQSASSAFAFMVRRIFRIWPLLWIATLATVAIKLYQHDLIPDSTKIALNLTGLFGFVPPYAYIATGAWSIGNEMVYYAITPFLLLGYNYSQWLGNLIVAITFGIGLYFSSVLLSPEFTLVQQWDTYIHPLNNLFLYAIGIAIYYNLKDVKIPHLLNLALLLISLLILLFYTVGINQIDLVTGWNRIIFIALSVGFVVSFYKFRLMLPAFFSYPLEKLGLVTYGVYILHPIVKSFVEKGFLAFGFHNNYAIAVAVIILTITLSLISYYAIEIRLMRLGKRLTTKSQPKA